MNTKPVPEGVSLLSPQLVVKNASKAIDFYKNVFCAEEMYVTKTPDGKQILHAGLRIAGQSLYLSDPLMGQKAPGKGGSVVSLHLYVGDADKVFRRALENGAEEVTPLENAFWGDRWGRIKDPFGIHWDIATHIEDVTPELVTQRAEKMMKEMGKAKKK